MYPQNAEILQGIYRTDFFTNLTSGNAARFYPKLSKDVPQDKTTVTYTSFGSVPEPVRLSGTAATAGIPRTAVMKDFKLAVALGEHQVKVPMPRAVAEDNPVDASGLVGKLGQKASVYLDRLFIACLNSSTALGYDGKVIYSTTHAESGSNQDNAKTATGAGAGPTGAEIETGVTAALGALMAYTDDQSTPVNEGVSSYTVLVNPLQFFAYKSVMDPMMSNQAVDSSGGTGKFRGMFNIISSALVTTKHQLIFANGMDPAVGYFHKTDWDMRSNMFTASDLWNIDATAMFTGYGVFEFFPWNWKSTVRTIYS